jgi:hypothetical protein
MWPNSLFPWQGFAAAADGSAAAAGAAGEVSKRDNPKAAAARITVARIASDGFKSLFFGASLSCRM